MPRVKLGSRGLNYTSRQQDYSSQLKLPPRLNWSTQFHATKTSRCATSQLGFSSKTLVCPHLYIGHISCWINKHSLLCTTVSLWCSFLGGNASLSLVRGHLGHRYPPRPSLHYTGGSGGIAATSTLQYSCSDQYEFYHWQFCQIISSYVAYQSKNEHTKSNLQSGALFTQTHKRTNTNKIRTQPAFGERANYLPVT